MWRVSALDRDGREVGRFELVAGEITIGRDSDRQLILPSASVSRRHARVYLDGGQPCIVDEGSANGVLVDGVRITQPTYIGAQTRIDVAEFRIALEPMGAIPDLGAETAPPLPPQLADPAPLPQAVASVLPPMRLTAEGGPYDGRVFELGGDELSVGRAVDNDIVLDDPSLSRKHAKLHRRGGAEFEVEDLGSSNGTFVNGRKIGRASMRPGDTVRFGELNFRVEGDTLAGTSAVSAEMPRNQFIALAAAAGVTLVLLVLMIVFLVRKPTPIQAPGKVAIARLAQKADGHLQNGKTLLADRKYLEARDELDQALALDPMNSEARRLRNLAVRAPEDDKQAAAGIGKIGIGDRKALNEAIQLLQEETTEGTPGHEKLQQRLVSALTAFGNSQCGQRSWADCAWGLCRAWELAPAESKPDPATTRSLREAERHIHDRSYVRCRAAP